jgi:hypothetical protein
MALLVARWAGSQTVPDASRGEEVRLAYSAPAECPDEAAFLAKVHKRIGAAWQSRRGGPTRVIQVTVTNAERTYRARIDFVDLEGGRPIARAIQGDRCETVVDGIALVTALAIDARIEESLDRSEPAESTLATSLPAASSAVQPSAAPVASEPSPVRETLAPPASSRAPGSPSLTFAARASVATGVGPRPALGYGGFFDLGIGSVGLGIGADFFRTGTIEQGGRSADFDLFAVRADVCPLALLGAESRGGTVAPALRGCAVLSAGRLHGTGHRAPPLVEAASDGATFFVAPGAALRPELTLGVVYLELELVALIPLNQHRFFFNSPAGEVPIHTVPPLAAGASFGLGLRFR